MTVLSTLFKVVVPISSSIRYSLYLPFSFSGMTDTLHPLNQAIRSGQSSQEMNKDLPTCKHLSQPQQLLIRTLTTVPSIMAQRCMSLLREKWVHCEQDHALQCVRLNFRQNGAFPLGLYSRIQVTLLTSHFPYFRFPHSLFLVGMHSLGNCRNWKLPKVVTRCRSTHISRPKQRVSTMDNSVQQYKTVDRDEKEQG